jgi:hypothetical protein
MVDKMNLKGKFATYIISKYNKPEIVLIVSDVFVVNNMAKLAVVDKEGVLSQADIRDLKLHTDDNFLKGFETHENN